MELKQQEITATGVRFSIIKEEIEVGRAYLYILRNDLHQQPFAFLEDVFIEETVRKQGLGSQLVKAVITEARRRGCYKLICTSKKEKFAVHQFYERLGFKNYGTEFRIDFTINKPTA